MATKRAKNQTQKIKAPVGRVSELLKLKACMGSGRNVLIEGPVGVGKTHLALYAAQFYGSHVHRVDGDNRYSEQKLAGWFDPALVIKQGYSEKSFVPGPLVEAMREGSILFINELNRLPEGVQNILLPAIDERLIQVPRLGEVRAKKGFLVVATQNPKEFVATSHLSEAILDRFELVVLDYQSESEEFDIVFGRLSELGHAAHDLKQIAKIAVGIARATRQHERVKRGASVRAALALAELTCAFLNEKLSFKDAVLQAALLTLPTRIEIERDPESEQSLQEELIELIGAWVAELLSGASDELSSKKKL